MGSALASVVSYLRLPVLASSGIATLLTGILYFKQNELIYPRHVPPGARTDVLRPSHFGIEDFEELMIPTPDGESLSAFYIRASNKRHSRNVTVLMFHGNAGNIGHRIPIAKILEEDIGCNVVMLQYRGYGLSTGAPNEKGLMIDAQTGLDYIRNHAELKNTKVVIYGQSLGGAIGVRLAAENQEHIAALVLENTFLSMRKLIPTVMPPAKYLISLCHQIWPTEETMPRLTKVPILFLSGLKDEIVPASHMKQLFDVCRSEVKVWKEFPKGGHNDTVAEPEYFYHMDEFIHRYVV